MGQPAETQHQPATYADLEAVPEDLVAEIIQGVLYALPRPGGPHTSAASVLGMDLGSPFHRGRGGPGGWRILDEPELHLGEDVLVPDLAGWRRERMPDAPAGPFITLPPDWVCEVLSPSTAGHDRTRKMPVYAQHGVTWLWIVDPSTRTLEVFHLNARKRFEQEQAFSEAGAIRAQPFDAIELELAALWDADGS